METVSLRLFMMFSTGMNCIFLLLWNCHPLKQ